MSPPAEDHSSSVPHAIPIESPPPARASSRSGRQGPPREFSPGRPSTNLLLFFATLFTVFICTTPIGFAPLAMTHTLSQSAVFVCALMGILMAHELGHYILGRVHCIELTLPYFIPIPFAFGTMGAVIRMKQINKRRALLDVGAAGPLAGMMLAIPYAIAGLALSDVRPLPDGPTMILGDSLLFKGLVTLMKGPIPEGSDVFLHPLALAAWFGFLVTALNLMPASQLDGGHITKAMFGRRHTLLSKIVFMGLALYGSLGDALLTDPWLLATGLPYAAAATYLVTVASPPKFGRRLLFGLFLAHLFFSAYLAVDTVSTPWLLWSVLLYTFRLEHPPIKDADVPLGRWRRIMGWVTMVLFVLTFTPMPIHMVAAS